jgi:hypothetical protein
MEVRGFDGLTVKKLAFTEDRVWAATDKGVFCYDRKSGGWTEYAVNRTHVGLPVDSVSAGKDGTIVFEMKVDGRPARFALDSAESKWKKLPPD